MKVGIFIVYDLLLSQEDILSWVSITNSSPLMEIVIVDILAHKQELIDPSSYQYSHDVAQS